MTHHVVWFDIPVIDLDRAIEFYSEVLDLAVIQESFGGMPIAIFSHEGNEVSGCLCKSKTDRPSTIGPLLYLNVNGRLDEAVAAVEEYGGTVLQPPQQIGAYGYRAIVLDSEGNRIALHSA